MDARLGSTDSWTLAARPGQLTSPQWAVLATALVAAVATVSTLRGWWTESALDTSALAVSTAWLLAAMMLFLTTRSLSSGRLGWLLISAGFASYGIGELLGMTVTGILGELPTFSVADVAWLAFYPLVAAGLVATTRANGSLPRLRVLLDAALVSLGTVSALLLAVDLLGLSTWASVDQDAVLATWPYLVGDVVLLGVVLALANARRLTPAVATPFVLVVAFLFTSDLWYWIVDGSDSPVWSLTEGLAYLVPPLLVVFVLRHVTRRPPTDRRRAARGSLATPVGNDHLHHLTAEATHRNPDSGMSGQAAAGLPHRSRVPGTGALLPLAAVSLAMCVLLHVTMNGSQVVVSVLAVAAVMAVVVRLGLAYHDAHALARSRIQARTDELTGLPNRRALLFDSWPEDDATTPEPEVPGSAVAVLEVNRFDTIEDAMGHYVGDQLLVMLAQRLCGRTRVSDHLARLEGEQFAVVLHGIDDGDAVAAATRLLHALEEPVEIGDLTVRLTGTVGVAWSGDPNPDRREQLRLADIARNVARTRQVAVLAFEPWMDDAAHRLRLTVQFEQALSASTGLALHYQPIVDLATGRPVSAEALLRWTLPDGTPVSPGEFLPLVQAAGHTDRLGDWVMEQAVSQIAAWRSRGIDVPVAVNVSAESVTPDLPIRIARLLRRYEVPADSLTVEIVEESTLSGNDHAGQVLASLRGLGVHVSIDDFGTGWSGLSYLRRMEFDALKIDRSFVATMAQDATSRAIVRSIVALACELDLVVVAEGIENEAEYADVRSLGANRGQGFGIARPMPADALAEWWVVREVSLDGPDADLDDESTSWESLLQTV